MLYAIERKGMQRNIKKQITNILLEQLRAGRLCESLKKCFTLLIIMVRYLNNEKF